VTPVPEREDVATVRDVDAGLDGAATSDAAAQSGGPAAPSRSVGVDGGSVGVDGGSVGVDGGSVGVDGGSVGVDGGLFDVLPSVARAIGVRLRPSTTAPTVSMAGLEADLPAATRAVVVLVDGLGDRLLAQRGGHAPFLRQLRGGVAGGGSGLSADGRSGAWTLSAGFPSTTATSMGTFGTGELPGAHGLVGLDVLDPDRDRLFNELAWDPQVDPRRWQPVPTVFEQVAAAGTEVVRIGPGYFDGSGLTEAALRGGRFVGASTLTDRIDAAVTAIEGNRRLHGASAGCLVYLYWGDVDKAGHVHGCDSWEWGEAVGLVDAAIRDLVNRLDRRTLIAVTADHGMVDVPMHQRIDLASDPELAAGIRHVGGEPRALHLYCEPGHAADVAAVWRGRLDGRMDVLTRAEAVAAGWFGRVAPSVLPRIGDVVTAARDRFAVVDSRTARPELLRLIGLHGARTPEEAHVPLLVTLGSRR
jgi:hypothetical protein